MHLRGYYSEYFFIDMQHGKNHQKNYFFVVIQRVINDRKDMNLSPLKFFLFTLMLNNIIEVSISYAYKRLKKKIKNHYSEFFFISV